MFRKELYNGIQNFTVWRVLRKRLLLTTIGTFADDTIILFSHKHPETASEQLQHHLNLLDLWAKKWKIKINESKCTQITFA
jgi:hypothetical protein